MIIAVPKEILTNETRVAATPETIKKFTTLGFEVHIQSDAGSESGFNDDDYRQAGAKIISSAKEVYKSADIILKINAPQPKEISLMKNGCAIVALFPLESRTALKSDLAKKQASCFALNLIPRISRAQNMDVLSSQSNLAGYKAALVGINSFNRAVPFMITAAGTIPPAKVFVVGVGVAGLQAIATAKRLGAQVVASDVRVEVKEQVESLGGKYLKNENPQDFLNQLKQSDIVITTAQIPDKKAPRLISKDMIKQMKKNSVLVDMAVDSGGNIEGSDAGKIVRLFDVSIIGLSNGAALLPYSASELFARNIYNFVQTFFKPVAQNPTDFNDEILKAVCFMKNGDLL